MRHKETRQNGKWTMLVKARPPRPFDRQAHIYTCIYLQDAGYISRQRMTNQSGSGSLIMLPTLPWVHREIKLPISISDLLTDYMDRMRTIK